MKLATEYEEAATKKRTSLHSRRVIQDLHSSLTGEALVFPSVRKHCDDWINSKHGEVAQTTLTFYKSVILKFLAWLGPRSESDLVSITREDIETFRNAEAASLSAKTVNHEVKTVRMLFSAARQKALIADDPTEFVGTLKEKTGASRRTFSMQELASVLQAADTEWQSMVIFGLYTGQRLIDIASLTEKNLLLPEETIHLTSRKTGKVLRISMAPPLLRHIRTLNFTGNRDFSIHPRAYSIVLKQGRSAHLSNQFSDILARAGLRDRRPHRSEGKGRGANRDASGLSFHSLRHTAVSILKQAGIPEAVVMAMIGHDTAQMSHHYTHVGEDSLRKAAASMPDLLTTSSREQKNLDNAAASQ